MVDMEDVLITYIREKDLLLKSPLPIREKGLGNRTCLQETRYGGKFAVDRDSRTLELSYSVVGGGTRVYAGKVLKYRIARCTRSAM